jgi:hypothetical protein
MGIMLRVRTLRRVYRAASQPKPIGCISCSHPSPDGKHDGFRIIARKTGTQTVRRPFGDGKAIFNYFHES